MKEDTAKYKDLMSSARTFDYYASITTGDKSERWSKWADNKRKEANALPDDYVDKEWQMPSWGTYGT
jgi:hypothetical protein